MKVIHKKLRGSANYGPLCIYVDFVNNPWRTYTVDQYDVIRHTWRYHNVRVQVRAFRLPISKNDTTVYPTASLCTILLPPCSISSSRAAPASWARIEMMRRDNWKLASQFGEQSINGGTELSAKRINSNLVNCILLYCLCLGNYHYDDCIINQTINTFI